MTPAPAYDARLAYRQVCRFERPARIPNIDEIGTPRLRRRWQAEGCPRDLDLARHFALDPMPQTARWVDYGPQPGVPGRYAGGLEQYREILAEQGFAIAYDAARCMVATKDGQEYHINHDRWGGIRLHLKSTEDNADDYGEGGYIHLRGALPDVQAWTVVRDHFAPHPDRLPSDWEQRARRLASGPAPVVLEGPSMVGAIALEMGLDRWALALADMPQVIDELLERRTALALRILDRVADVLQPDMLWFWEDMAYCAGPVVSPRRYRGFALRHYRVLADWWRARNRDGIVAVDSDGDVRGLIPVWIDAGINHIWPFEPKAHMDVVDIRRRYGDAFSMRGGIDKFCVGRGREAIDRELDRIFPVVRAGGYIPHLDHMLPDCSFADFSHYMERKRQLLAAV
jgi:hypothetical protein